MTQLGFPMFAGIVLLKTMLTQCGEPEKPVMDPFETETWSDWLSSGWSEEQWNPIIGVECSGSRCGSLRLLTYNVGIIQGSLDRGEFYDTEVFSDPHNWKGLGSKVECKKDHIVTRVWCNQAFCDNLKLRCTKLKQLSWCDRETCDGDYRHWTEILSNEDRGVDRAERRCKRGTVLVGMECIDTYFCDRKRLLCEAITPPAHRLSSWWQLYQLEGGESTDIYSVTQTNKDVTEHIFKIDETWQIHEEKKQDFGEGNFKGYVQFKYDYKLQVYEELKNAYTESLRSEHIRLCEPKCREEGKSAFLWMMKAELVDRATNASTPISIESQSGFFQAIPGCLVRCVTRGSIPQCPPIYCEDEDCQWCTEGVTDALIGELPIRGYMFSAALQQHHCWQVALVVLIGIFTGTCQRSM